MFRFEKIIFCLEKCLWWSWSWSLITEDFHWLELAARSWSIIGRLLQSKTKQWLLGSARGEYHIFILDSLPTYIPDEMDQWILDGFSSNLGGDFQWFWKDGSPIKCNYPPVLQQGVKPLLPFLHYNTGGKPALLLLLLLHISTKIFFSLTCLNFGERPQNISMSLEQK